LTSAPARMSSLTAQLHGGPQPQSTAPTSSMKWRVRWGLTEKSIAEPQHSLPCCRPEQRRRENFTQRIHPNQYRSQPQPGTISWWSDHHCRRPWHALAEQGTMLWSDAGDNGSDGMPQFPSFGGTRSFRGVCGCWFSPSPAGVYLPKRVREDVKLRQANLGSTDGIDVCASRFFMDSRVIVHTCTERKAARLPLLLFTPRARDLAHRHNTLSTKHPMVALRRCINKVGPVHRQMLWANESTLRAFSRKQYLGDPCCVNYIVLLCVKVKTKMISTVSKFVASRR